MGDFSHHWEKYLFCATYCDMNFSSILYELLFLCLHLQDGSWEVEQWFTILKICMTQEWVILYLSYAQWDHGRMIGVVSFVIKKDNLAQI